jgi:hypothetical protein
MPADIYEFMSSFNKDLARPNRFEVSIATPKSLKKDFSDTNRLNLRCESAELPSRTFATAEQKFGSNPIEKYPYQVNYNDINLTFIVSDDMYEKYYFDAWHELIMPSTTFNATYKDVYVSDIIITQFNLKNDSTYSIKLIGAYPIVVNQLDLDWSSDGYHKLTVVFAYTYWAPVENVTVLPIIPIPNS